MIKSLLGEAIEQCNPIFTKIISIVFFVENHISDGSIFQHVGNTTSSSTELFFNNMYNVSKTFGISLLTLKLLKKILDTYVLQTDGDAQRSPESLLIGYAKGLALIFCFSEIYKIFVGISQKFIQQMINAIGLNTQPDLTTTLDNLSNGLFSLIAFLVFFILYICLVLQFIKRGLEMLILRIGFPLACSGLIDSDRGVFAPYIKMFLQNSITVLVQISLIYLGCGVCANGNIFFGITSMLVGLSTPKFIQQFLLAVGENRTAQYIRSGSALVNSSTKVVSKVFRK